jgi:hypothetical protein
MKKTALLAVVAVVLAGGVALALPLGNAAASESGARSAPSRLRAETIVFTLDTTRSVTEQTRTVAKAAIADALIKRAKQPHGAISFYARLINLHSGTDGGAAFTGHIPAVAPPPHDCDPFDPSCQLPWMNAHNRALKKARGLSSYITHNWSYQVTSSGSEMRGAITAGAQILDQEAGDRWLVLATDLRPSNARMPTTRLDGIHVDVILACTDAIANCQRRESAWRENFLRHGASTVAFFSMQQATQVLSR